MCWPTEPVWQDGAGRISLCPDVSMKRATRAEKFCNKLIYNNFQDLSWPLTLRLLATETVNRELESCRVRL